MGLPSRPLLLIRQDLIESALTETPRAHRGRRHVLRRLGLLLHHVTVALERLAAADAETADKAGRRLEIALRAYNDRVLSTRRLLGSEPAQQLLLSHGGS